MNMSAVYALFGVVLIPVSFLAIRLSQKFIHPVVFTLKGPQMTHVEFLTFCVSPRSDARAVRDAVPGRARRQAHRRAPPRPSRVARAMTPQAPPSEWQYVAAAYLSCSSRCSRGWRSSARSCSVCNASSLELVRKEADVTEVIQVIEVFFWPAVLAYGEAALAYTSARTSRVATWGVRVGWLAQTALLAVQAARADGFPWSSWSGSLNLFVWLVVGAYLIWGCRPSFRLLGLAVMPLAVALFVDCARGRRHARRRARPTTRTSSSCCTWASCSPRSQASRSPRRSRRCISGRRGG